MKKLIFIICFNLLCLGASGVARLFHDAVLKEMSQANERPIIFALYDKYA
jgi:malic enzyme